MLIYYDSRCAEYATLGHPEAPFRAAATADVLRHQEPGWQWERPVAASREEIVRVHTAHHWDRLATPRDFDADTPYIEGIRDHAARAAGGALAVARQALAGVRAFSLMRPPGHHACADEAMGFCYLNSVALAAFEARALGAERVAVFDFDAHHGNGTQDILAHKPGLCYGSVHQYPCYPGTGGTSFDNIVNAHIPPEGARDEHMMALGKVWRQLLAFQPSLILVSAGFDAYRDDPLTEMSLEENDFHTLGCWLRECGLPVGAILEGGYSRDLPELVLAFLRGWEGAPAPRL
ncbi:histone deacetylase [Verrucomicrobia bacterium LW23]|nr:histone deacetylase [Verrucomicrobia bacterium LW23]